MVNSAMKCRHFENNLPDWISGRVSEETSRQMLAHVASCASCSRMSEEERGLRSAWRALPIPAQAPDIWPQLAARIQDSEAKRAGTRSWRSWFSMPVGSVGYGLAGAVSAVVILAVVYSRTSVVSPPPYTVQVNPPQIRHEVASDNYIQLVSDRYSLPDADGDLAIGRTPRYRQAERIVLGHGGSQ